MKKDDLRLVDYLGHLLQAIDRINSYTEDMDENKFLDNAMVQDAVIRNIEIIGEASKNILRHYPEFALQHSDIPWEDIYLMRNRVAHGYFSIDFEIVWKTLQRDIPELEQSIRKLFESVTQ